jgi:hypothetical protein
MSNLGAAGDPARGRLHGSLMPSACESMVRFFSGPEGKSSELSAELSKLGVQCDNVDILRPNQEWCNLLDDTTWSGWVASLSSRIAASFWGPPCGTFSPSRNHRPGPPVLRSTVFPFGLPEMLKVQRYKEEIRIGNVLADRTLQGCEIMYSRGCPFGFETPEPRDGEPSILLFPRAVALLALPGVRVVAFDQCQLEGVSVKPTVIVHFKLDLTSLDSLRCLHPKTWCSYVDIAGATRWV